MEIFDFTPDMLEQVAAVEQASFSVPWCPEALLWEGTSLQSVFLVGCVDGIPVGYVIMRVALDIGDIVNVAVHPDYRSKGCGFQLLQALIQRAESKGISTLLLEVRKSNRSAIKVYTKAGFVAMGLRKNYYTHPVEDAILMSREKAGTV